MFAVNNLKRNLLGLPAIKACSIVNGIISQYPSLFSGLGKFGQEYTIKFKLNPSHLHKHCKKHFPPMRTKVQTELQWLGVILPMKEPTPWCVTMVKRLEQCESVLI